jgi:HSP20 family protein
MNDKGGAIMQLVRWNPWNDMMSLRNRFNRIFEGSMFPMTADNDVMSKFNWNPAVDVYDTDNTVVIKAELPGIDKKDLSIDVNGRVLTLKGERSGDNEVKEEKYYRKERFHGKFERSFTLPDDTDPEKIQAEFKDGVLKIEVPKPEEKKPKQITVH